MRGRGVTMGCVIATALMGSCAAGGARGSAPVRDGEVVARHAEVHAMIEEQIGVVETFFDEPMDRDFEVHILEDRAGISALALEKWGMPELPCWAVAMGTGSTFVLLDPATWATEACDHDPSDTVETERIIAHELVHVFHGQHRRDAEFNEAEDAAWFVEGLAVLASGQLDETREGQAAQVVKDGRTPARLAEAWTGQARYAIAGTMVRLVEARLGREGLKDLLEASTSAEVLGAMGMSEAEFIGAWEASVRE